MMVTVYFNPDGGSLGARAVFLGDITANYEIFLRPKDSNLGTSLLTGDNLNDEDDTAMLPSPPVSNDGRRVVLETGFLGNHSDANPNYEIRLEIHQDGQLLGSASDAGTLTGKGQYSLLFVKLTAR